MTTHELVVTDVTCYGSLYCVAGWDIKSGKMIRPEPATANMAVEASRFWSSEMAGPDKLFALGNVVRFDSTAAPLGSAFPHATEDRLFDPNAPATILRQLSLAEIAQGVATGLANSLLAVFGGALVRANSAKAYVPAGHCGPSLGAMEIAPHQIKLFEDKYDSAKPKLRACITDGGITYDLSVPADAARTRWKTSGLAGLRSDLDACKLIHLRLGLSRPFSAMPDACYSQVNGVYFL